MACVGVRHVTTIAIFGRQKQMFRSPDVPAVPVLMPFAVLKFPFLAMGVMTKQDGPCFAGAACFPDREFSQLETGVWWVFSALQSFQSTASSGAVTTLRYRGCRTRLVSVVHSSG